MSGLHEEAMEQWHQRSHGRGWHMTWQLPPGAPLINVLTDEEARW